MVAIAGGANLGALVNYWNYRSIRGQTSIRLNDITFSNNMQFEVMGIDFELVDANGVIHYKGTAWRNWGQPGQWYSLGPGNGAQWASLRVRITDSYARVAGAWVNASYWFEYQADLVWS